MQISEEVDKVFQSSRNLSKDEQKWKSSTEQ